MHKLKDYNRSAPAHNSQLESKIKKEEQNYNRSAPAHNSQLSINEDDVVVYYNRSAPAHNSQPLAVRCLHS